jgi:hypothetical protein
MTSLTPLFCQLAITQAASLPSAERADLYEYAAHALNSDGYPEYASAAAMAAKDLRNADAAQSHFEALLSAACNQNKVR